MELIIMEDQEARRAINEQAKGMKKLAEAIADAAQKQRDAELRVQQEKTKNLLIEVQSKLYDRASAYTNLILVGGYAGSFAIWGATRSQLPLRANIAIALSLGLSLVAFIFFEIYKGINTSIHFMKNRAVINNPAQPADYLKNVQEYAKHEAQLSIYYIPIWISVLIITIGSALVAWSLLFYNYFALLVKWPPWPT